MPGRGVALARRLARRSLDRQMLWVAARRFRRIDAPIVVCWDLDNTLVDSGSLLHGGRDLTDAIVAAAPMAGMLEFVKAVRAELPSAAHVVLSVRTRGMRSDTLDWLRRHGVDVPPEAVCFAPSAAAKAGLWKQLAAGADLVVVDDLSYGHEAETPSRYVDLTAQAEAVADVYVGLDDIAAIAGDRARGDALAAEIAARLG